MHHDHCDGYSLRTRLRCTYGNANKHARGAKYIDELERKVDELEDRLRGVSTGSTSLSSPTTARSQGSSSALTADESFPSGTRCTSMTSLLSNTSLRRNLDTVTSRESDEEYGSDDAVHTICAPQHEQPFSADTEVAFRGHSSGIEIIRSLRGHCDRLMGVSIDPNQSAAKLANALDRAFPSQFANLNTMTPVFLPPTDKLMRWTSIAFAEAFSLWPCIDRQTFEFDVRRLLDQQSYLTRADQDSLSLIYAVLALGQRFDPVIIETEPEIFELGIIRG